MSRETSARTNLPGLSRNGRPVCMGRTTSTLVRVSLVAWCETSETAFRTGNGAADSQRHAGPGYSDRRRARRPHLRLATDSAMGHRPVAAAAESEHSIQDPDCLGTYRWCIVGTLVVVAGNWCSSQTHRADQPARAEAAIRRSEASLRASYERIRQMARPADQRPEAARADIARDLHDDVCQQLVYVSMGVSTLKNSSGDIQARKRSRHFQNSSATRSGRSRESGVCRTICIPHPCDTRPRRP